jgi:hypothetical protein
VKSASPVAPFPEFVKSMIVDACAAGAITASTPNIPSVIKVDDFIVIILNCVLLFRA